MRAALCAQIALGTAVGAGVAGLAGTWVAGTTIEGHAGTAVRAVLVVVTLVVVTAWSTRRELLATHRRALRGWATLGLLFGYLLTPFAWRGDALAAGASLAGPAAWAADLVVWMAVGTATCLVATRTAARTHDALGYTA